MVGTGTKDENVTVFSEAWSEKTMGGRILCKDNIDIVLLTDAARGENTKLWNAFAVFQITV